MATDRLALLDTDVLVHLVRQDATGQAIEARYSFAARPERAVLSSIVEGEILGLAWYWNWGEAKRQALQELLAELVRVDAGLPEIVEAYAQLYAEATRGGKPRGENDLWIAATAKATAAALYTCNRKHFEWMDPEHVEVHAVEQAQD